MLPEEPLGGVQRVDLLSVGEHRDIRRNHLLLAIVADLQRCVAQRVAADLRLLARLQRYLGVAVEAHASKTQ